MFPSCFHTKLQIQAKCESNYVVYHYELLDTDDVEL